MKSSGLQLARFYDSGEGNFSGGLVSNGYLSVVGKGSFYGDVDIDGF